MPDKLLKRSWVEIDLGQIKKNYQTISQISSNEIMAVVKADAYGHGAVQIAKALQDEGVKSFAVSNINEAIELREKKIEGLILILGYTPIENLDLVLKYDVTQALLSKEYTKDVIATGKKIKAHYAIDTGMNRIGLNADDVDGCKDAIKEAASNLNLLGLFTHLCVADTPSEKDFTNLQIEKFQRIVDATENLGLKENHCLNSAGGLFYDDDNSGAASWHDKYSKFTRAGIVLYGLKPDYDNTLPKGIKPAMAWKSVVSMIKKVPSGQTIGYGRTFETEKEITVATIPTGYADGYNRSLSNKGFAMIHGKKAPIVGRVCMDQFMVDVSDIPEVKLYDEAILLNDEFTADDMARNLGTIGYEIICNISTRVERVYK